MKNSFQSVGRIFFVAALTMTGITGCGEPSKSPNGETNSPTSKNAPLSERVSAPDVSVMDAAVKGDVNVIRQHIAAGTDLNQRDPMSGSTALIVATLFGQNETAILLIEGGADLEVRNNEGSTALHLAAFLCREEITRALLAKDADRTTRNNAGATALDSVAGPFDEVKPIYDILQAALGPLGLKLDYERIKTSRPKMAELLRAE